MTAASRPNQHPVAPPAPAEDFDTLYDSYFGFVWRCLRGLGVAASALDDATQDVFLVVHRRLPTFRAESSVRTWLYGIVRNVASNHRRSRRRRPDPVLLEVELPSRRLGPEDAFAEQESLRFVQQFLEGLSQPKRELFVLALLEQLSIQEVADILGIPLNTAYTRLRSLRQEFVRAQQTEMEP